METPASDQRDFRSETIRLMVRDRGDRTARLLAWHPDAARLRGGDAPSTSLSALLWDELEDLEWRRMRVADRTPADRRTGVGFYVRRRVLARYREIREARGLPELWQRVSKLARERVGEVCVEIGTRVLAALVVAADREQRNELTRNLSRAQQNRVRLCVRSALLPAHSATLVALWFAALDEAIKMRGPARVDEMLGRILLATLFQELSADERKKAIKSSRTTFCEVLERTRVLVFDSHGDRDVASRMVADVLGLDLGEDLPDRPDASDD